LVAKRTEAFCELSPVRTNVYHAVDSHALEESVEMTPQRRLLLSPENLVAERPGNSVKRQRALQL